MLYTELAVGDKTLKLRLTTRAVIALEKKLGKNPLSVFTGVQGGELPTVSEIIAVLHASLQALEHGYTEEAVCDLYDEYIDEGHNLSDIIPVVIEVFQVSGLIGKEERPSKNAKAGT